MRTILAALVACFVLSGPAAAVTLSGVELAPRRQVDGVTLLLNGAGLRKAMFIGVKVYVAGLYLERRQGDPAEVLKTDGLKQLVLHFLRDVSSDEIHEDLEEGFDNHDRDSKELQAQLEILKAGLGDVKEGQELIFTFHPAYVVVEGAGVKSLRIDGAEFRTALLEVWLGKDAAQEQLKTALLGADPGRE